MKFDFSQFNLEVIDINTNVTPVIYINQRGVTFSRRVLEDMGFPAYVQFCMDVAHRVFAIRACKGSEAKATQFSKPRAEQKTTLSINNRNMHDTIARLIEGYDTTKRYSVDGHFDPESKVMYYDMKETKECAFHKNEK